MKLKAKINLYTAVMFIILLILLNLAIFFSFRQMLFNNEIDRSYAEALKTVEGIKDTKSKTDTSNQLRAYLPINGMFKIVNSHSKSTTTITDSNMKRLKNIRVTYYQADKKGLIRVDNTLYAFVSVPIITAKGEIANLQVVQNLGNLFHMLNILKTILIIVTVFATIPVFLSSHILSRIISKPILSMIQTMGDIQKSGQYKHISLRKHSKDELQEMGETFNAMMGQLENNYNKQEQFIMNASHELKTPLTVIESYSDLLKRRGMDNPELFTESIEAIHSEAIRMRKLTKQLLQLTKSDAKWKIQVDDVPVVKLLHETVRYFHSSFECKIELFIKENIVAFTDPQKLKQLLYIFIENACKYSEGNVQIEMGRTDNDEGWITITDDGIGIPEGELDKVFERFYRVDKARDRKTGGFGLGLSLAKTIADVMDITIKMTSDEGKGTTAKLIFPLVNSN